jgi:hypothetical protein
MSNAKRATEQRETSNGETRNEQWKSAKRAAEKREMSNEKRESEHREPPPLAAESRTVLELLGASRSTMIEEPLHQ